MNSIQPDAWGAARSRLHLPDRYRETMSSSWLLGNVAVVLSVLMLLFAGGLLSWSAAEIAKHVKRVDHAQEILRHTGSLQDALNDASAAARAYTLSHDGSLLEKRAEAKRAIWQNLAPLLANPVMAAPAREAELEIRRRVAMFDVLVAGTVVQTLPMEIARINQVRLTNRLVAGLRGRADSNLDRIQHNLTSEMRVVTWIALLAAIAAPLFGLTGIHLLRRDRDSRRARELQMELMHVQRLAIMGETSAMLAHEINQPLAAANNYLAVLRRHLDTGTAAKAVPVAERVSQQIQRASAILRKLRRFIEKRESERSLEAPEVLVDDALTLLGTIDTTVHLETHIEPELPNVLVDRVQLQQVLVNLMRNAIEAMQSSPRRELHLSLSAENRHAVEICLADTGPGLSPEVAGRLFQPFVSTKQGGMGVGLSITRSIIEQHGGRISAEPNPGGGTIFRFTLPSAREQVAA